MKSRKKKEKRNCFSNNSTIDVAWTERYEQIEKCFMEVDIKPLL